MQSRKNNESIGIITLNEAQQFCIADIIESEAARDEEFRLLLSDERNRIDDGLYSGLFIKSADNVQGDERDVIILSVGYSKNERGELSLPLSAENEGDVNVLNVALTRARSKAIIITSLNSEDIVCDGKQEYTLLLKKYLAYAEAVAVSDKKTASSIIESLGKKDECISMSITDITPIGTAIKNRLEDEGYKVDLSLGSAKSRISLAIYDQKTRGYILGIELDSDALPPSVPHLERDIYKRDFLEAHGWNIKRVWCRDWWHDPNGVISDIVKTVEKIKKNA